MAELRLCPYCYGEARILPEGDYHEVTCEVCGSYAQGHTYEDAVNAWNCGEVEINLPLEVIEELREWIKMENDTD